jgi:hypothetical protein
MLLLGGGRQMMKMAAAAAAMMMMMMVMTTMTMTRVVLLSADEFEGRCARGCESRKIRVVRIVVVRGDRHMTVDAPSSIARMLFRSLDIE